MQPLGERNRFALVQRRMSLEGQMVALSARLCQYEHSAHADEKPCVARRFPRQCEVFPAGVRDDFGYALYAAQSGEAYPKGEACPKAKPDARSGHRGDGDCSQ